MVVVPNIMDGFSRIFIKSTVLLAFVSYGINGVPGNSIVKIFKTSDDNDVISLLYY